MKSSTKWLLGIGIGLFVLISAAAGIRLFSGPEDDWICVEGQWVQHGHPSAPQPTLPCNSK